MLTNPVAVATAADVFPDLTEADMDLIFNQPRFTADEQTRYKAGWDFWEMGVCSDNLDGFVLVGWLDAEAQYAEERAAERQLFAQLVGGAYV